MPAASWRVSPARNMRRWETISASFGVSRVMGRKYRDRRMLPWISLLGSGTGCSPPETYALSSLSRHSQPCSKLVDCDQPVGIDNIPEGKDERGDDARPNELASEPRKGRSAGVGALGYRPRFVLTA